MTLPTLRKTFWCALLPMLTVASPVAGDVVLEKVISREHSLFQNRGKFLNVGRDGMVYVGAGNYLVRMNRDGTGKVGVQIGRGQQAVATDGRGNFALADSPHRGRQVLIFNSAFEPLGAVGGFLSGAHLNWGSPCDVQSGESGDFYAIDQHRNRILRIAMPGKTVAEYSLRRTGEDFVDSEPFFRVVESMQRFYVAGRGRIHAVGFDGRVAWTIDVALVASHDAFDADDEGNLYVLRSDADSIEVYGLDGQRRKPIALQMADLRHGHRQREYVSLELFGDEVFLKRHRQAHPTEIFRVYDRHTGALKRVVHIDAESVRAKFPSALWTAGKAVPFEVTLKSGDKTSHPNWPVQIAVCNDPQWIDLPIVNGKVTPPTDAAGLYALRIGYGDLRQEAVVEIRQPGSQGTINILTPRNRVYYGRGEEIPVTVIVRGPKFQRIKLHLSKANKSIWSADLDLAAEKTAALSLPAEFTAALSPGRYLLTTEAPSMTVASQPLVIGPGLRELPRFKVVQGGDGGGVMTKGNGFEAPEAVDTYIRKANKVGANMVMSRAGYLNLNAPTGFESVAKRLANDPLGVAPEKAVVENVAEQTIAAHGAFGIEQQLILLHMDTFLPFLPEGKPSPGGMYSRTYLSAQRHAIESVSKQLLPYPAFRGWSWASNWWINPEDELGTEGLATWKKLLSQVNRTHQWQEEVIGPSDRLISLIPDADKALNAALQQAAPGKLHAATGPYRQPWVIPPISFRNVDEVDLFLQSEQIQPAYVTPHNADFYKRPSKRAFGHIETGPEDGVGNMAPAIILLQAMRGVDGTGWEGKQPSGAPTGRRGNSTSGMDNDARSTGQGVVSVFRGLSNILRSYGPWLTTLEGSDRIAIVVSTRMMRIDEWGSGVVGAGEYFNRLFEAYTTCLFAHRPAVFVFTEDLQPGTLDRFKAVLVVDQQLELDPPLSAALRNAREAGVRVFFDGTCRAEFVRGFEPLNVKFDQLEKDAHLMNDDAVYWRLPRVYRQQAEALRKTLGDVVPPVANVQNAEIALSERHSGEGRFVWVVNNDYPDWEPGILWRVGNFITTRVGQSVPIDLNSEGQAVYELFGMKEFKDEAVADLRQMPARLFAVVPKPIEQVVLSAPAKVKTGERISWSVTINGPKTTYPLRLRLSDSTGAVIDELYPTKTAGKFTVPVNTTSTMTLEAIELISGKSAKQLIDVTGGATSAGMKPEIQAPKTLPVEASFGPHLRDLALSADHRTVLVNAMNWDDNFFLLDTDNGAIRTQGRVGHQFAYQPLSAGKGFYLQGYDVCSTEGYHLYDLGMDGKPLRRFANFGLPDRWMGWRGMGILTDRVNNFAVPSTGAWIASAGNLGLIVWASDGGKLWSQDWWTDQRQEMFLLVAGKDTLVTLTGMTAAAYEAATGQKQWETKLADSGFFEGGASSADGRTVAVYTHTEGGRVFVLRDGKLTCTLPVLADNVYLTADGQSLLILVGGDQLRWYSTDGSLQWDFHGDDYLIGPRISPDGKRIAVGSQIGTLAILDSRGGRLSERDFGSVPMTAWLPEGELLVATWMGDVLRVDAHRKDKWHVKLAPQNESQLSKPPSNSSLATIRPSWGNSVTAVPEGRNLLASKNVAIRLTTAQPPSRNFPWKHPIELFTDGNSEPPATPWCDWTLLNSLDFFKVAIEIDAGRRVRVDAVTFFEDPAHPESWLRDIRLQVWDEDKRNWADGPYLVSDAAVHSHRFENPVEGAKFRFKGTGKMDQEWRWPIGNIRLGELVFHGSVVEQ